MVIYMIRDNMLRTEYKAPQEDDLKQAAFVQEQWHAFQSVPACAPLHRDAEENDAQSLPKALKPLQMLPDLPPNRILGSQHIFRCFTTYVWVTQVGHGGYSPCAVALGFPVVCMQHLYERSMDGEKKSSCF